MPLKRNLSIEEKRNMIADAIVISERTGNTIIPFIGVPLSKFNYDSLRKYIREMNKEYKQMAGEDYYAIYSTKY